jgi:DNA-binding response OmpR family regulator
MADQKDIKIWVLEDDKDDRESIQEALIKHNIGPFQMLEKTHQLFAKLKGHLDIMIVDFHLKADLEDGDRVVQKLKNDCEDCYAIVISTLETKKEFIRVIRARADDYVDKEELDWTEELVKAIKIGKDKVAVKLEKKQKENAIREKLLEYQQQIQERIRKKQEGYDSRSDY